MGAPSVVQQDQWHLGSAGTQVWSPAWLSVLKIQCCCSCSSGHNCGLELIPGPGTPYATGQPKMKKKQKKKKEKKERKKEKKNIKQSQATVLWLPRVPDWEGIGSAELYIFQHHGQRLPAAASLPPCGLSEGRELQVHLTQEETQQDERLPSLLHTPWDGAFTPHREDQGLVDSLSSWEASGACSSRIPMSKMNQSYICVSASGLSSLFHLIYVYAYANPTLSWFTALNSFLVSLEIR